jgi:exodeoxyribonuclease-3
MAFRNKTSEILLQKPDIVVVQECECIENLKFPPNSLIPTDILWYGENKHKGIGIFSYSNYKFELLNCYNSAFKYVLPIAVTVGEIDFLLFAIWANNATDKDGQYITQIWKAINYYEQIFNEKHTILAGDFNSNKIWDKPRRIGNHSDVVLFLEEKNIFSTYHQHQNKKHGLESKHTHFLYRHQNKPITVEFEI